MTVGINMAKKRRERGISQVKLAELADVSADWVRKVEQGRIAEPSLSHMLRVADALGVEATELYGSEVPVNTETDQTVFVSPERARMLSASYSTLSKLSTNRLKSIEEFLRVFEAMDDDEFHNPTR